MGCSWENTPATDIRQCLLETGGQSSETHHHLGLKRPQGLSDLIIFMLVLTLQPQMNLGLVKCQPTWLSLAFSAEPQGELISPSSFSFSLSVVSSKDKLVLQPCTSELEKSSGPIIALYKGECSLPWERKWLCPGLSGTWWKRQDYSSC